MQRTIATTYSSRATATNGKIRMKESAKTDDASDSGKDEGRGN